jgi:hypothetical protein
MMLLLSSVSCKKKKDGPGKVTFYTTESGNWSLILDGVEKGKLKNTFQQPVCGDATFQVITLEAGEHTVDAKSLDGFAWGDPKKIVVPHEDCISVDLP